MIRGALVLGTGLAIGYAKGLSENVAILDKIDYMARSLSAYLDDQAEKDKAVDADAAEVTDVPIHETPEGVITP